MPRFTSLLTGSEEYRRAYAIAYGITYQEAYAIEQSNFAAGQHAKVVFLFNPNLIRQTNLKLAREEIGFRGQSEAEMVVKMACDAAFKDAGVDAREDLIRERADPQRQALRRLCNEQARAAEKAAPGP